MKRVIIVDDLMEFGRMVRDTLLTTHPELKVNLFPSAEEALLEASRTTVDLLVSDIRLPGISGMDLVSKIRARQPNIPIIMVTGQTDNRLEQQAMDLSVNAFFRKPMSVTEFLAVAEQILFGKSFEPERVEPDELGVMEMPPVGVAVKLEVEQAGISQILSDLRQRLGATAVILINDLGRIQEQIGTFPDPAFETQWIPAGMAALSASLRLNRLAGSTLPESALAVRGPTMDVLLAPVGTYMLVLALPNGRSSIRLPLAVEEILMTQREMTVVLQSMGINILPHAEPAPRPAEVEVQPELQPAEAHSEIEPESGLDEFAALLQQSPDQAPAQDLDSFWENASSHSANMPANPDMLTFDQARQLGLAPDEGDK